MLVRPEWRVELIWQMGRPRRRGAFEWLEGELLLHLLHSPVLKSRIILNCSRIGFLTMAVATGCGGRGYETPPGQAESTLRDAGLVTSPSTAESAQR